MTAMPSTTSPTIESGERRMRRARVGRAGFTGELLMSDPLLATSKKRLGDAGEDHDDHEKKDSDSGAVRKAALASEDLVEDQLGEGRRRPGRAAVRHDERELEH